MKIGAYDVIRPLAAGGMSEALVARSPQGRTVVLKRPLKRDADLIARLRDEARIGGRVFHPNLVETLDAFESDGMPVIVVGYVEGASLDMMRKLGALPAAAAARVGCQVAEALTALHGALGDDGKPMRAVHRDVTSRNIMVTQAGESVLIDLGIARADEVRAARTETGMVIGTIRYLAPELIDGLDPSSASDLWSLGCVVYEVATGEPAFSGPPSEVALKIHSHDPLNSPAGQQIAPELRRVLARLLQRDPRQRVREAHEASALFRTAEQALGGGQGALAARVLACTGEATAKVSTGPSLIPTQGGFAPEGSSDSGPTAQPSALATAPLPPPVLPPVPAPFAAPAATRAPDIQLELDRPARVEKKIEPMADPKDFYPKQKADLRWLTAGISKLLTWGVVLAVLVGGYWYWTSQEAQEQAAELRAQAEREAELLKKAMAETAPQDGPCDGPGTHWAYDDAKGTTIVVDALSQVPKKYRSNARCVRVSGR